MTLQSLPWYGQMLVFLLIGGIFVGIYAFTYHSDGEMEIKRLDNDIDKLDKEIRGLKLKESKIEQMRREVEAKKVTLEKLKEILPEQKDISQILKKIQSIITTARLKITKWTNLAEQPRQVYVEVPIQISVEGNYHNLGMFFDQMAKLKKIFTIKNLSLTPMQKMNRAYSINANFIASTYTFRDDSKAQSGKNAGRGSNRRHK